MPNSLEKLSDYLNQPSWQKRLSYTVLEEGQVKSTLVKKTYEIRTWDVIDASSYPAVIFAVPEFIPLLANGHYGFLDATFQSVPIIKYGFQFLTFMTEVYNKVSLV